MGGLNVETEASILSTFVRFAHSGANLGGHCAAIVSTLLRADAAPPASARTCSRIDRITSPCRAPAGRRWRLGCRSQLAEDGR